MNQSTLIRIAIGIVVYLFVFLTLGAFSPIIRIIIFTIIYFPAIFLFNKFTKNR